VPVPTEDSTAKTTVNQFAKCYQNSGSCPTTGKFLAGAITSKDGTALPSWITYTSSGTKV